MKFDFAKMQSLLETLNSCSRGLAELSIVLEREVNGAGQWWKGVSYDAFKANYISSGKSKLAIEALSDRTKDVSGYLCKVAEAKKSFERNTSMTFK